MKIAFISAGVLPIPAYKGGAVETLVDLLTDVNETHQKYECDIYTINPEDVDLKSFENKKTKYISLKQNKIYDFMVAAANRLLFFLGSSKRYANSFLKNTITSLIKNEYDYVIVQNRPQYMPILKDSIKDKLVLHLHNDHLNSSVKNRDTIYDSCDKIIVVSNFIKSRVLSLDPKIDKIKVVHNGIDFSKFAKTEFSKAKEIKEKFNIEKDSAVITFIGRLEAAKGVDCLVEAFSRLENENLTLLIVGGIWFSSAKENKFLNDLKLKAKQLKNKVIFAGYVDHSDIPQIHSLSDILVVPSKFNDPCPLAVLEAMHSGTPLIVSNAGGIPELVGENNVLIAKKDNKDEFHEALTNHLNALIKNKSLREELSNNAFERSKLFSAENFYFNFIKALKENE